MDSLEKVFFKALDESINSVDDKDLNECFADLKQLGNHHKNIFINIIYKAQTNMIHRFKDICTKHNIESTKSDLAESSNKEKDDKVRTQICNLNECVQNICTFHYSMHKCKY